jgi:hypothetical protein
MQATTMENALLTAEGIVQGADHTARKLHVQVNDEQLTFDIPANCRICLGEEQVGLRKLTPLDHVKVVYEEVSDVNVAQSIHASWFPFSPEAK